MGCERTLIATARAIAASVISVMTTVACISGSYALAQEDTGSAVRIPPIETRGPLSGPDVIQQIPAGNSDLDFAIATPRRALPSLLPFPDRWRVADNLGVIPRWYDPYNQNYLKGDRPVFGKDWFFVLGLVNDTLVEPRRIPTPVGGQATNRPGELDVFGNGNQLFFNSNMILSLALIEGDTTFRPADWEFRVTTIGNVNYLDVGERGAVNVNPDKGTTRLDTHVAIQELFVERHLRNKSENYDFDSLRVGIQPFITDFRGFLFFDSEPGVRLFGNWFNNRLQYNAAAFWRLEKDTNSGLNTVFDTRNDQVFALDAFYQDWPVLGFTPEALLVYNRNRDGDRNPHYNTNGFLERPMPAGDERPHNYDVVYLGSGGDGHIGPVNLTSNLFLALGSDDHNPIAQRSVSIFAYLLAAEASIDRDWMRFKAFAYHASGDHNPHDGTAQGFDAISENPNFAGADSSYFVRQGIPLVGGGGVLLKDRNALLPDLRSSKLEGQSNFVNPGVTLAGVGADFDVLPELRLESNAFWLGFDDTASLRVLRQQGGVAQDIGYDLSLAVLYRPLFIENVVFRVSGALLTPQQGFKDLFGNSYSVYYSSLVNMTVTY